MRCNGGLCILLVLSRKCNLNCVGCSANKTNETLNEDNINLIVATLKRAYDLYGISMIIIHGAENTLIDKNLFSALMNYIRTNLDKNIRISFQTNLYEFDDEWLDILKRYNISVSTSYRGTKELFNKVTGVEDSYDRFVKNFKKVNAYMNNHTGCILYIPTTYEEEFYKKYKEIIDDVINIGITNLQINEYEPSLEEIKRIKKETSDEIHELIELKNASKYTVEEIQKLKKKIFEEKYEKIDKLLAEPNKKYGDFVINCQEYVFELMEKDKNIFLIIDPLYKIYLTITGMYSLNCAWIHNCDKFKTIELNGNIDSCNRGYTKYNCMNKKCLECPILGICYGGCSSVYSKFGDYLYCNDRIKMVEYVINNLNKFTKYYKIYKDMSSKEWMTHKENK